MQHQSRSYIMKLNETYYVQGQIKEHFYENDKGEKNGIYIKYDKDGTVIITANYDLGELSGEYIEFYLNGNEKLIENYKNGFRHGRSEYRREDKTIQTVANYVSGNKIGESIEYFPEGGICLIENYEISLHGKRTEFYPNGNKKTVELFENGRREGGYEEFYENGNKKIIGKYKLNLKSGEWREYFENDNTENYNLKSIANYTHGRYHGKRQVFHTNGNLHKSENYCGRLRDGEFIEYDTFGNPRETSLYKLNKLIHKHMTMYAGDVLESENFYLGDKEVSREEYELFLGIKKHNEKLRQAFQKKYGAQKSK